MTRLQFILATLAAPVLTFMAWALTVLLFTLGGEVRCYALSQDGDTVIFKNNLQDAINEAKTFAVAGSDVDVYQLVRRVKVESKVVVEEVSGKPIQQAPTMTLREGELQ